MIAGFTGTREGMTANQKSALLAILPSLDTIRHGDCVGADEESAKMAWDFGSIEIISHPPIVDVLRSTTTINDEILPAKDYLDRDRDIVDASDVLIAAPKSLVPQPRSGTWYTINYAKRMGKPIIILHP